MKATSKAHAWEMVNEIFPTDYIKDDARSKRAGYDIYYSTAAGVHVWISDLEERIEVNLPNGKTVNIWIAESPEFSEYSLEEALRIINNTIYDIDDKISDKLAEITGIKQARNTLYEAYSAIAKLLKEQHPKSKLFEYYNLDEAYGGYKNGIF